MSCILVYNTTALVEPADCILKYQVPPNYKTMLSVCQTTLHCIPQDYCFCCYYYYYYHHHHHNNATDFINVYVNITIHLFLNTNRSQYMNGTEADCICRVT
jgi:hypothetical protein